MPQPITASIETTPTLSLSMPLTERRPSTSGRSVVLGTYEGPTTTIDPVSGNPVHVKLSVYVPGVPVSAPSSAD